MQNPFRIFVINPGSTSTKVALFEDETKLYETSVFHEAAKLEQFATINDQLPYRLSVIRSFLEQEHIDLTGIDAIVGRGGSSLSVESGVYEITPQLVEDTRDCKGGTPHCSMLGVQLAYELHQLYGGRMFMVDPIVVDELSDLARMTGLKGLTRTLTFHALNQKGIARKHAASLGIPYESLNLIVAHIDGGITIGAHKQGRVVDCNSGAGGDGPYTPSRIGSIGLVDFMNYMEQTGKTFDEMRHYCNSGAGFISLVGTNDSGLIHQRMEAGDADCRRAWQGMLYQVCKCIGQMAVALDGRIDGILLTGGLLRFPDVAETVQQRCGWIAPITCYPGEVEHEAMADGALRVLRGQAQAKQYTGRPVFEGFDR